MSCSFRHRVHDCAVLAGVRHVEARDRTDNNHSRRICRRARSSQQWHRPSNQNQLHVPHHNTITPGNTHSLTKLNTPLTFRSRILTLASSGASSNLLPQVAPAFATKISNFPPSDTLIFSTNFAISFVLATLAAMPTAVPVMLGRELSLERATLMPFGPSSLRAVIITLAAPARRKAVAVWRPRPRDPGERC
jgi:hypothetical protein